MGKLKQHKPRLSIIRPYRIQAPQGRKEYDQHRNQQEWRKWYKTARWRSVRWAVLVRDKFTCQMCGLLEGNTSQLVADHKARHGGDPARFWDEAGIQCLCKPCHDGAKQKQDNAAR